MLDLGQRVFVLDGNLIQRTVIHYHTPIQRIKSKPPYVCPGCSNHTYGEQYVEQIQYLVKLQARIFTK
jgi:hypothetical protein